MRYGIALGLLLAAPPSAQSFQLLSNIWSSGASTRLGGQRGSVIQQVAAAPAFPSSEGGNTTASSIYLANLVTDAVQSDDDAEEIELAERRRKITERFGSYRVTLPLSQTNTVSQPLIMGMTIRQFSPGPVLSDEVLNLDSLVFERVQADASPAMPESTAVETITPEVMKQRLNPDMAGVYVASVTVSSPAWNAGIRPGDLLTSTAATFGGGLWSKSTLEGVRSALISRRMTADSATFEFRRTDVDKPENVYELTLSKPIGLNLRGMY
jgi:hypothetical protein